MKPYRFRIGLMFVLLGVLFFQIVVFADVEKLSISQIIQRGNDVYLYVNTLDNEGKAVTGTYSPEQFSVNIDKQESVQVLNAEVFESLDQGASYIFCIDVSKSVTETEMEEIRNSITDFINGMSVNDYARIITIGTEIIQVCDSTQDKNILKDAVNTIERTANYTYLYKGLSFALDSQRKNVDKMPERAAIILFTDGMDDSDGASSEEQVLIDIAETRIPVYVVGLKGKDSNANLNSVGQIARQSGGSVFSYNDMTVNDAVQAVRDLMCNTFELHIQPETEIFGTQNMKWTVTYNSEGYSVSSTNYVYSLGLDGVVIETEAVETETEPAETEEQVIIETEQETETEKSFADKAADLLKENLVIFIASVSVLIAVVIILVNILQRRRTEKNKFEWEKEYPLDENIKPDQFESTLEDVTYDDEKTVGEIDIFDDEATVSDLNDRGMRMEFEITFEGQTGTVERVLREQLILGRGNECDVDVVLHSASEERKQISRKHAFIITRPDGLYVKDNSKNKTYLNGVEVVGEMALRDEDILQMGRAIVKVKILSY